MENPQIEDEARVLLIYTGGTVGMVNGPDGYAPEANFLTKSLLMDNRFNDPERNSMCSLVGAPNIQKYLNSNHITRPTTQQSQCRSMNFILVRSSRPIVNWTFPSPGRLECIQFYENPDGVYEAYVPSLVTPRYNDNYGMKSVRYTILEWDPLLDSCDIKPSDYICIARTIELNYHNFDAFVILHGTDTMAYTASALSFLLEGLTKNVILTGSQISISELRTDATENILTALILAGHYDIPELSVYFNRSLFRGNRVVKCATTNLNAFESPNFPPLAKVEAEIRVNLSLLWSPKAKFFQVHKEIRTDAVHILHLYPGIQMQIVRACLAEHIKGLVLAAFGTGNAPQCKELLQIFKEACDRGVVIIAVTQCSQGSTSNVYKNGQMLLDTGVIFGGDMTAECAWAKLGYLLSKNLSPSEVRRYMMSSLCGELTERTDNRLALRAFNQNFGEVPEFCVCLDYPVDCCREVR